MDRYVNRIDVYYSDGEMVYIHRADLEKMKKAAEISDLLDDFKQFILKNKWILGEVN